MLKTMLMKLMRQRHPGICACPACSADVQADPDADEDEDEDDALSGCGWFASSHALQSGLRVTEHALDDAATVVLLALTPGLAPAC